MVSDSSTTHEHHLFSLSIFITIIRSSNVVTQYRPFKHEKESKCESPVQNSCIPNSVRRILVARLFLHAVLLKNNALLTTTTFLHVDHNLFIQ